MIAIMVDSMILDYQCKFDMTYRKGVEYNLTKSKLALTQAIVDHNLFGANAWLSIL